MDAGKKHAGAAHALLRVYPPQSNLPVIQLRGILRHVLGGGGEAQQQC